MHTKNHILPSKMSKHWLNIFEIDCWRCLARVNLCKNFGASHCRIVYCKYANTCNRFFKFRKQRESHYLIQIPAFDHFFFSHLIHLIFLVSFVLQGFWDSNYWSCNEWNCLLTAYVIKGITQIQSFCIWLKRSCEPFLWMIIVNDKGRLCFACTQIIYIVLGIRVFILVIALRNLITQKGQMCLNACGTLNVTSCLLKQVEISAAQGKLPWCSVHEKMCIL